MKELGSSTVPLLKPVSISCLRVSLVTSRKPKPVIMLLGPYALLHLSKLKTERIIILLPNYLTLPSRLSSFNLFTGKCLCIYTRVSCYKFPYKTELYLGFKHDIVCLV